MTELGREELGDFLRFCRSERRLAPMTCSAYERDVSACLGSLRGEGIEELAEVKVSHLRAPSGVHSGTTLAQTGVMRLAPLTW
jgi:site-specific recombinase XerD